MKKSLLLLTMFSLFLLVAFTSQVSALSITPTTGVLNSTRWEYDAGTGDWWKDALSNDFGIDGNSSNTKIFSHITYFDGTKNWLLVSTRNGDQAVRLYRTSNDGDL